MTYEISRVEPLLAFIRKHESGDDYNIVWARIKKEDRPEVRTGKKLVQLTIGQVLDWQDSIDKNYMSEAAGAYQILEDTLRNLHKRAAMTVYDLFSEDNQDRLAYQLLVGRGLHSYLNSSIRITEFGNNLAKEWASLPVVAGKNIGRSHYAGDGLNQSLTDVDDFLAVLRKIKEPFVAPTSPAPPMVAERTTKGWASLAAYIPKRRN